MPVTDISAFVGAYPFRALPHSGVNWLLEQMDRVRIDRAWVGHLSSPLHKDPAATNAELERLLAPHRSRLSPIPTLDPGLPGLADDVRRAQDMGAPAVRVYPVHAGLPPDGPEMNHLVATAATAGLPVVLTVRFEDLRQRHPLDVAADLPAAAARSLARAHQHARILVTHADRSFVEEVHFGLTADEARRVLWDVSWIWGPPEDHLQQLLDTMGATRFAFGSGMPLRIPDASLAKLDLLEVPNAQIQQILQRNLDVWCGDDG